MNLKPFQIADSVFSKFVLARDKNKCQRCGKPGNQCSHYHRRGIYTTRYEPKNCICLCNLCHRYFENNRPEYELLMISLFGVKAFDKLFRRAALTLKSSKRELINAVIKKYKK